MHGSGPWSPGSDGVVAHFALDTAWLDLSAAGNDALFEDIALNNSRATYREGTPLS